MQKKIKNDKNFFVVKFYKKIYFFTKKHLQLQKDCIEYIRQIRVQKKNKKKGAN